MGTNRIAHLFGDVMADAVTKTRAKHEPTAFGLRFDAVMKLAGFGSPKAISDALAAKNLGDFTPRQVGYFRTAEYESIADAKETTTLLKACADLAGVSVAAFFGESPPAEPTINADEELIGMVKRALAGPKREFLADAIDLAFSAAISSTNRRHA